MDLTQTTRLLFPFILSFSLISCGGGGFSADTNTTTTTTDNTGTSSNPNTGTDTSTSNISSLRLSTSSFQLQSASNNSITLSAIAKDSNNVLLSDADIQISVDNDADLTATSGTSVRTATLSPGTPDNRVLTVTAKVGDEVKTLEIEVLGTTLVLDGPVSITTNKSADYKVRVRDSADSPVGNRNIVMPILTGPCTFDSSTSTPTLNSAGEFEFSIVGTSTGTCTLESNNFGANASMQISVSGDEFTITPSTDKANDVVNGDDEVVEVSVGVNETINLLLKKDGVPVTGKTIQLSSTRGTIPASVDTDSEGKASFEISSNNSGNTVVTASVDGLQALVKNIEFVADNPIYITTQASPSIVKPLGKSVITTTIQDTDNNPVKNKIITFNLTDTVGGTLNTSESKTDSLGRASIEYTAGNTTSETDGVIITSNIQGASTITSTTKLTVGGNALRIVLGTNNKLTSASLTYTQQFIVIVTDSAGNPVSDQEVNFSLVPTAYYKGTMIGVDTDADGEADAWASAGVSLPVSSSPSYVEPKRCLTEDNNNNANLDLGEDIDGDSKLEPTHDASVSGSTTTDGDGSVILNVTYAKSRALWSEQKLVVRTSLSGSEYEEATTFKLNVAKDDVSDIGSAPPSSGSPYGKYVDCSIPD